MSASASGSRGSEPSYASTVSEEDRAGSYDVFYDRLQPEGNWYDDDTYGYVWQPRVAERDDRWRPYTDGHWAYTDRGWCWVSNEDFGWATYHYGRWIRIRGRGWVWIPGNEWAPAWVSWRHTDDDETVGWAHHCRLSVSLAQAFRSKVGSITTTLSGRRPTFS